MAAQDGGIMPHRGVAGSAFGLDFRAEGGIGQYLMAHLGAPERVFGRIGHQGSAPLVVHVHIIAKKVHQGILTGIVAVATGAGVGHREDDGRVDGPIQNHPQQLQLGFGMEVAGLVADGQKGRGGNRQADEGCEE